MKILNLGSLNIDYVYHVAHFVRPQETLSSLRLDIFPGGKGLNQSVALARAGAQVFHLGKVGQDGLFLKELLDKAGADTRFVSVCPEVSGHAIIQVDERGENCILLHGGANQTITPEEIEATLAHFAPGDMVLMQNETSGGAAMMEKARRAGLAIALNPSPITPELFHLPLEKVSWLILNEVEGEALSGEKAPEKMLDQLARRCPGCGVVLTLGSSGVLLKRGDMLLRHGAYRTRVVDTTAAGDTFTGYFLSGITCGQTPGQALALASKAAAIAVSRSGASPSIPALQEVLSWDAELAG